MPLDLASFLWGMAAAYGLSFGLFVALCIAESRHARKEREHAKERECAIDELLAGVGIASLETPPDVRVN